MASNDNELEEQLREAGNKLLDPPSSVEELLPLLDEVESCLAKVEQSPTESMQRALAPSLKVLVDKRLFKHTDRDVKVAVASCISEITRITAPEAPYNDDQMRDVFQLIVSSFENLAENTSRSFNKRTLILETVAKVRSCVVMLDLECDALIIEMFQLFLNSIRDYHQENVFSSMETIMTLVLKESEDISVELLSPLLASLRRDNKEVLPIARKLGEKVLENCAPKVKPYLAQAIKSLGASISDYSDVVASICPEVPETVEQNDAHAADENKRGASSEEIHEAVKEIRVDAPTEKQLGPPKEDNSKTIVSNGVSQAQEDKSVNSNSSKKDDDEDVANQQKDDDTPVKTDSQNVDAETVMDAKSKQEFAAKKKGKKVPISKKPTEPTGSSEADTEKGEQLPDVKTDAKDASVSPCEDPSAEITLPATKKKDVDGESSMPNDMENESENIISPSLSENIPEETPSKKGGRSKKKESSTKDSAPSREETAKKASEEESDSGGKPPKRHGKKGSEPTIGEDKTPLHKDTPKKERGTSSKSKEKPMKPSAKKVEPGSANGDQSSSKHTEDKKRANRGKVVESDGLKSSTKDSSKEKLSLSKSDIKSMKDVQPAKESPKAAVKRKHTPDAPKGYGEDIVGEKIKVWWPKDRQFYAGKIESFEPEKGRHKVVYNDGDVEVLNLKRQRFEFIGSETESDEEEVPDDSDPDGASDMPLKKKVKTNHDQTKKQMKSDALSKQGAGASSTKSKGSSSKSGQRTKESSKTEGKLLDDSKYSETVGDDVGAKSKDHNTKVVSKSADASKSAGKQKHDDKLAKASKSKEDPKTLKPKQETPKSSKVKQDTPKSSSISKGKPSANGSKQKSGSSKDRAKEDDEDEEENSTDSAEAREIPKLKVASSSKGRGSESKSSKKRRRA